ncbi:MAG: Ig-like domain-containing protein [Promethearchaeota archaeon]
MKKKYSGLLFLFIMVISSLSFGNISTVTVQKDTEIGVTENACVDAWIIIVGDRSDHHLRPQIMLGAEHAYDILIDCGYTDENIYYLIPDLALSLREDDLSSRDNIQWAIETWAVGKVSASGELGIYMVDHGGTNYFCLDPNPDLTDVNLDTYLTNFEAASGCDRIFIIYDACHTGSFHNPVSDSDRIVVASTDTTHSAYLSPLAPNRPLFSESFWTAISTGATIGEAFEQAEADVHALGYGASQFPTIDDNHDEVGHEVDAWGNLPNGGDGNDALNVKICDTCIAIIWKPPLIFKIPIIWWIPWGPYIQFQPWVVIQNETPIKEVYVRMPPPQWMPPTPKDDEALGEADGREQSFKYPLSDPDGDGNYTGNFMFYPSTNGTYPMSFIVEDENGKKGKVEATAMVINEDGMAPPDITDPTIHISNPLADASVSGTINITAEGNDDQELDEIKIYINGSLVKTETMPDYLPYPEAIYSWNTNQEANGIYNITAVGKDHTGNTNSTSIFVNVQNAGIPSFQITTIILGCFIVALTTYIFTNNKKKKPNYNHKL